MKKHSFLKIAMMIIGLCLISVFVMQATTFPVSATDVTEEPTDNTTPPSSETTIPPSCNHSYGEWVNQHDGFNHGRICSLCQELQLEGHTWNAGTVLQDPSCVQTGLIKYVCTRCNEEKTAILEDHTRHSYDNGCDTSCNLCGEIRTTDHQYAPNWYSSPNGHWHQCTECQSVADTAPHTPGPAATEYTAQTCTICGYVIRPAFGHQHNFDTKWTTGENGHWYACSRCTQKGSYAVHSFANDCDPDCDICGYTREIVHSFEEAWTADSSGHWHKCSVCGLKQDEAQHQPGPEATATTPQYCTVCEFELVPALGVPETTEPLPTNNGDIAATEGTSDSHKRLILIAVGAVNAVAFTGVVIMAIEKKKKKI